MNENAHYQIAYSNSTCPLQIVRWAQTLSNAAKSAQRQLGWGTLKYHQKLRIWCFQEKKNPMHRRNINAYAHRLDFQYKNFEDVFSIVKNNICWWISPYLIVGNIYFLNVPHLFWVWDFVNMYLTHLGTRIKWCTIHAYLKKLFFGPPKLCCPPLA